MKVDELLDVIGEIDDSYLTEAKEKTNRKKIKWVALGSLAACFLFVLFIPYGFLHRIAMMGQPEVDYTSKDCTKFLVYYADGDTLSHFAYEIYGGYEEMFFAWKNQNGIDEDVVLKGFDLRPIDMTDGVLPNLSGMECTLRISVSASFASYMEEENGQLLLESLKMTVASYTGAKLSDMELIFVE